jgi:hypothetical protein
MYRRKGWQFPTKKLFCCRRNRRNNWFVPAEFRLFRETENFRNSVPNRPAEEKNARNSVPWNKNRSKLSEFCSEPFRGTENFRNSVSNRSAEEKNTQNSVPRKKNRSKLLEFRSEACHGQKHAVCSVCWSRIFCKTNIFMPFFPILSLGINSSVNLGMLRNEHFLPQNNGSHSKSIPRNFFWNKILLLTGFLTCSVQRAREGRGRGEIEPSTPPPPATARTK